MNPASASPVFDAIVLAASPHADERVVGLSLVTRGEKVAARVGARRVLVIRNEAQAAGLAEWNRGRGDAALLVVRAGDQVVHMPLLEPLLAAKGAVRIAIDADGGYAGAVYAEGEGADALVAKLAVDPREGDASALAEWTDPVRVVHGEIARHPATTRAERAAAEQMMLRLLHKSEDGPVSKYLYRPVSRPLTRLLVRTPITPNQVSLVVLVLGMIGCWFTAQRGQTSLIIGTSLVLLGGFIDGCDGEIARLRLLSSKIGAWLDTVVDELTTTVFLVAIGYHVHLHAPAEWVIPSLITGVVSYVLLIYGIYFFLVVVSKTGNSQHYVGKLDIADDPLLGTGLRPRVSGPSNLPLWVRKVGTALAQVVRRDFINLGAVVFAFFNGYLFIYVTMLAGGVVAALIIIPEHFRLRGQLRQLAARGARPQLLPVR